mmetsp:Transcript_61165/g.132854  ORF Transcript_61165/g.132854 Transcript_61165/m.132854 type:complete len:216 (-) Transcript_61165:36-683(-)
MHMLHLGNAATLGEETSSLGGEHALGNLEMYEDLFDSPVFQLHRNFTLELLSVDGIVVERTTATLHALCHHRDVQVGPSEHVVKVHLDFLCNTVDINLLPVIWVDAGDFHGCARLPGCGLDGTRNINDLVLGNRQSVSYGFILVLRGDDKLFANSAERVHSEPEPSVQPGQALLPRGADLFDEAGKSLVGHATAVVGDLDASVAKLHHHLNTRRI